MDAGEGSCAVDIKFAGVGAAITPRTINDGSCQVGSHEDIQQETLIDEGTDVKLISGGIRYDGFLEYGVLYKINEIDTIAS